MFIGYIRRVSKGFTLVELAISLVIIALLLGMGAQLMSILTLRAKYTETKEKLSANVDAVISFAAMSGRLPANSTEFASVARSTTDAWGKDFVYVPEPVLVDASNGTLCARNFTNMTIKVCTDASCSNFNTIRNVAFMIISGGDNYNVQTSNDTTSVITVYFKGAGSVDDYPWDVNRAETYDDFVKWVTLFDLKSKIDCAMSATSLRILNNELPYGNNGTSYNATIYADGGIAFPTGGKYRWCIEGNLPPGLGTDPPGTNSTDCSSLPETSWNQATSVSINGTPSSPGSYNIRAFVRDNSDSSGSNDNIYSKAFVITINP